MYESNTNRSQLAKHLINQSILRRGLDLSALAFVVGWLALSPQARAVCREGCTGVGGTFLGDDATTGHYETAIGAGALGAGVYHISNTVNGANTLHSITTGNFNTALGVNALFSNEAGNYNTANGANALSSNTIGNRNVAGGSNALFSNQTGNFNTAIGFRALYQNIGENNLALGFNAGSNLTDSSANVCVGYNVLGVASESNTTRMSNIYSSAASARLVYINSDGKLGALVSSQRFKKEIRPMDKASEAILALTPVSFHYKREFEPNRAIMFGLIAEDVEKVDPDLVTRDGKGEAETVRYEAVNAMLLNEFLKQHRKVEEQGRRLHEQERTIAKHQGEIRVLASQIQKACDEVKLIKSAPRTIASLNQ